MNFRVLCQMQAKNQFGISAFIPKRHAATLQSPFDRIVLAVNEAPAMRHPE
jgi:hypothetical protein